MCIFLYFGYVPSPKTGSVCETESLGMRGSGRLGDSFGIRKAAVTEASGRHKCLLFRKRPRLEVPLGPSWEAWSWNRAWALAGLLHGFQTEACGLWHLEAEESEFHCQERRAGWGLVHQALQAGGPFPCRVWSLEPGNQRSYDVCHCAGKETEALCLS